MKNPTSKVIDFEDEDDFHRWLSQYDPADQAPEELIRRFLVGINALGIDVYRSSMWLPTAHPEIWGTQVVWTRSNGTKIYRRGHDIYNSPTHRNTPGEAVHISRKPLRWRLDTEEPLPFPLLEDVKNEGATDYTIIPVNTDHVTEQPWITFATQRRGGFSKLELKTLNELCVPLGWKARITIAEVASHSLLSVYLGDNAAKRVINGEFRRGTGEEINAIIWYSDLRGFTNLAETRSAEELIDILDQIFECLAGPIEEAGGEILKFIGDAILAIFPLTESPTKACKQTLDAAVAALENIRQWSSESGDESRPYVEAGIALHIGNVVYGNIGGRSRLDFTVIGSSVNLVSRVESLCESTYPLLTTASFTEHLSKGTLTSIGKKSFKGIEKQHEIYTLAGLLNSS